MRLDQYAHWEMVMFSMSSRSTTSMPYRSAMLSGVPSTCSGGMTAMHQRTASMILARPCSSSIS